MNDLKNESSNKFSKHVVSKDMFLNVYEYMINSTEYDSELIKINEIFKKSLSTKDISIAGKIIKNINKKIPVEKRLELLRFGRGAGK